MEGATVRQEEVVVEGMIVSVVVEGMIMSCREGWIYCGCDGRDYESKGTVWKLDVVIVKSDFEIGGSCGVSDILMLRPYFFQSFSWLTREIRVSEISIKLVLEQ